MTRTARTSAWLVWLLLLLSAIACVSGSDASDTGDETGGSGNTGNTGGGGTSPGNGGTGGSQPGCSSEIETFTNIQTFANWSSAKSPTATLDIYKREDGDRAGKALHMKGSETAKDSWGASVTYLYEKAGAKSECKTKGFKFWAKGQGTLIVGAAMKAVIPPPLGTCQEPSPGCYNAHQKTIGLSGTWMEYPIEWSDLSQRKDSKPLVTFDPNQIVQLSFSFVAGEFELWLDDLSFIVEGDNSNVALSECQFDKYMNENTWNGMFSSRNSFYRYADMCAAAKKFTGFANSTDPVQDKREIAAFLAHVWHETGGLAYVVEQEPTDPPWHGRGPLQLTHKANYELAAQYLKRPELATDPTVLERDGVLAWEAALWFWNIYQESGKGSCHTAMSAGDFGKTISIINGKLECPSASNQKAQRRIEFYQNYCSQIGNVDPGDKLNCGPEPTG